MGLGEVVVYLFLWWVGVRVGVSSCTCVGGGAWVWQRGREKKRGGEEGRTGARGKGGRGITLHSPSLRVLIVPLHPMQDPVEIHTLERRLGLHVSDEEMRGGQVAV